MFGSSVKVGSASFLLNAYLLLGLFFGPEDGGDIFHQWLVDSTEYKILLNHCCENHLKSYIFKGLESLIEMR
jgi:hypothetical protein